VADAIKGNSSGRISPESVTSLWRIAQPFVSKEDFSQLIVFPDTTCLSKKSRENKLLHTASMLKPRIQV
jgi:hypothetical protein